MDVSFDTIIRDLSRTVNELEFSVMQAYEQFLAKYGVGHEYSSRLESYFPAIDKQREYIDELDSYIKTGELHKFYDVATKIRALSDMIKTDAKDFLLSMGTNQVMKTQDEQVH
jgi:hypothetical protein